MRLLVVSPIASHPQEQGNSARIFALCKSLQTLGHLVHFLYYPLEGLTAEQSHAMTDCWDGFHTLPVGTPRARPPLGMVYGIDDWYDPRLGQLAARLHHVWRFDAVLVNYVWMSGVLEELPSNLPSFIDTHDVFGDRQQAFADAGLAAEWFYTSVAEERRGLLRARCVIAIQEQEAAHFSRVLAGSSTRVVVIGQGVPRRFLPARERTRPVVGYLGSGNPFNVSSIQRFARELKSAGRLEGAFDFVLAGRICDRLPDAPGPFKAVGPIGPLEDFYGRVDLVVNPMLGGTGLKIKTLEALSFGLPVLGTDAAWIGIGFPSDVLPEASDGLLPALRAIAEDYALLARVRERCRHVFNTYLGRQLNALVEVFGRGPTPPHLEERPRAMPAD